MEFHEICVYFFPKIEEKFGVPNFVMNKSYLYRHFLLLKYLGMVYQSNLETCPKRGEPTGGETPTRKSFCGSQNRKMRQQALHANEAASRAEDPQKARWP